MRMIYNRCEGQKSKSVEDQEFFLPIGNAALSHRRRRLACCRPNVQWDRAVPHSRLEAQVKRLITWPGAEMMGSSKREQGPSVQILTGRKEGQMSEEPTFENPLRVGVARIFCARLHSGQVHSLPVHDLSKAADRLERCRLQ